MMARTVNYSTCDGNNIQRVMEIIETESITRSDGERVITIELCTMLLLLRASENLCDGSFDEAVSWESRRENGNDKRH